MQFRHTGAFTPEYDAMYMQGSKPCMEQKVDAYFPTGYDLSESHTRVFFTILMLSSLRVLFVTFAYSICEIII